MQACKLKFHACTVLWCRATTMIDDAYNHLYNGKPDLVDKRFQEARSAGAGPARCLEHLDSRVKLVPSANTSACF